MIRIPLPAWMLAYVVFNTPINLVIALMLEQSISGFYQQLIPNTDPTLFDKKSCHILDKTWRRSRKILPSVCHFDTLSLVFLWKYYCDKKLKPHSLDFHKRIQVSTTFSAEMILPCRTRKHLSQLKETNTTFSVLPFRCTCHVKLDRALNQSKKMEDDRLRRIRYKGFMTPGNHVHP